MENVEQQVVDIIAAANARAADTVGAALLRHDQLTEQLTGMGEQLVRMADDRKALDEALTVGRAALDELEVKLAAAREAIGKLLG